MVCCRFIYSVVVNHVKHMLSIKPQSTTAGEKTSPDFQSITIVEPFKVMDLLIYIIQSRLLCVWLEWVDKLWFQYYNEDWMRNINLVIPSTRSSCNPIKCSFVAKKMSEWKWFLTSEAIIKERDLFYITMKWSKQPLNEDKVLSPKEMFLGSSFLTKETSQIYIEWLQHEKNIC